MHIYIKSCGFNDKQVSRFTYNDNDVKNIKRGFNIIAINNSGHVNVINYDSFLHNYENNIYDDISKHYHNPTIKYIILLSNDESTNSINVGNLQNKLIQLNIKLLKDLKFRGRYFFIFNNNLKKLVDEQISNSKFIEKTLSSKKEYNDQIITKSMGNKPKTKNNIYVCCRASTYKYFREYVESFSGSLRIKCIINEKLETQQYNDHNGVYLFCQEIPLALKNNNFKKMLLNTEQCSQLRILRCCHNIMNSNIKIVDYSQENINLLKELKNIYYLPYQYRDPEINKLKQFLTQPKTYDIAFCGRMSPRRSQILDELKKHDLSILYSKGWGDNRDTDIAKCKILLNIHFQPNYNVYESIRCDRWTFAGMFVVSEKSVYPAHDVDGLVTFEAYDKLVETVLKIIRGYNVENNNFKQRYDKQIKILKYNRRNNMAKTFFQLQNA